MLNGYKSKPFNTCKKNDYVYQFIVSKNYKSFWKSPYHENIKFLEKNYNGFKNNKLIQDLFEKMFEFDPMKRMTAKDIEHHPWFTDMDGHENLLRQDRYKDELQRLHFVQMAMQMQKRENKQTMDNEKTTNNFKRNDSTMQSSNESSLEISADSEMMKQLENHFENNSDKQNNYNSKSEISKLLAQTSDNTSNFVKSPKESTANK